MSDREERLVALLTQVSGWAENIMTEADNIKSDVIWDDACIIKEMVANYIIPEITDEDVEDSE